MNIDYRENPDSQAPALDILRRMGWQCLSPSEADKARGGLRSNVILTDILTERLAAFNGFTYKHERHSFSSTSIANAVNALQNVPDKGIVKTNELVYDLLTLGKSFTETVRGDQKAFTLRYIDWVNLDNNVFHVTEEFPLEGPKANRRPDIVCFVNGIPFIIIENKRRDKEQSCEEAVSQHIRNQRKEEGAPRIYHYAQILIATQPNELKYACTGTHPKYWSIWKEDGGDKKVIALLKAKSKELPAENRLVTEQDRGLFSLCSKERILELAYKYLVFDGPDKKICRYQQYFAVQDSLARVKEMSSDGKRSGGVIWHTTGSGKSLTMVMLSKALALDPEIESPRVIVVTDRKTLDKQIWETFNHCEKVAEKAKSGADLIRLIKDKGVEVITTIIDKFDTAAKRKDFIDESSNIFVLVDESHRSQYGTANRKMRQILPNACYIGFTGTPLLSKEKSTSKKFGGFIHKYTIDQAVKDKAVLPLLYEGRSAKLSVNSQQIDKGFNRLGSDLNEMAQRDLKKKFARIAKIYESEHVIEEIAYDISKHYCKNWKGGIFKAQLATPRIDTAVKYQRYFEQQTDSSLKINTRVIFTPKDSRKDNEDAWTEASDDSRKYWTSLMEKHHGQDEYEKYVIDRFKEEGTEVELIIVVQKLLTGFDAPRNTVLYLAKPLHSHNLLQAIARVNRLFEGKEHGHIIDYVGILGKLDEALTSYSALDEFDEEDLKSAVIDIREEVRKVPIRHAEVWEIFKSVENKNDTEGLERHLGPKDIRDKFYERVTEYAKVLHTALASDEFYDEFNEDRIHFFKAELKRMMALRKSVQLRFAEVISYKQYEPRVRKLLDSYVVVDEVELITYPINIFEESSVAEALETYGKSAASKADFIASRMKKVITENLEKDEAFYKRFSQLIQAAIDDFQQGRVDEQAYLKRILDIRDDLQSGDADGIPTVLASNVKARAFFGALSAVLSESKPDFDLAGHIEPLSTISLGIDSIISSLVIRDWKRNRDVKKLMENDIEDFLISQGQSLGLNLDFDTIDMILSKAMKVAINNY